MSYDSRERSASDGAPVELYHFALGGRQWRFATAAEDVSRDGHTWLAGMLRREGIEASTDQARNNLKITVSRDFPVADLFRIMPPTDVILLRVYRYHDADADTALVWAGRVLNCSWSGSTRRTRPATVSISAPTLTDAASSGWRSIVSTQTSMVRGNGMQLNGRPTAESY